ncbi:MAG TPA: tetratricopeptide repeat protein [Dehalococcoidia bacterium]|nr:tetratricopeptide repeat protein [Dehalococcoidia bacterium]
MFSERRFISVFFAFWLVLYASLATAQKNDFFDALIGFHSALFGRYGDEGPLAASALDRMAASLDAWEQSQIAGEEALRRAGGEPAELARFYAQQGRFDEATRAIAAAIAAAPDRSAPRVFYGLLQEATGRTADAADTFAAASRIDRTDPVAAYLAASRLSTGAPEQLELTAAVLASATREPGTAGPASSMQLSLIPDSASRTPVFAPARYAEGFALLSSRRFREAMEQFRTALENDPLLSDPARLNPHVRDGAAAMRENRTAAAIQHLESAATALAESSEAHRLLGLAYRAGARPQDAIRHLRNAVRLAPHDERAGVALGTMLTEAGNLADAENVLRQTIEVVPASGVARWMLAVVYDLQNRGIDALSTLDEAVALPIVAGRAAVYWRIAQLANRHQKYEQVITALARRARLLPDEPEAHKDLGAAFLRIGRVDEALTEFLMTLFLGGEDAVTVSAIGQIHLAAERFDAAERALRRAVALNPANPQARYALGNTLIRIGKTSEGMQHLKEFERLRSSARDDLRRQFEVPINK